MFKAHTIVWYFFCQVPFYFLYSVLSHVECGSEICNFTDKSCASKRKFNLAGKDESKPKRSKARTTKGEKQINSVREGTNASHSSQTSQCLVYSKEKTDKNLVRETVTAIGGRDTALFLFRALGKILYCKSE